LESSQATAALTPMLGNLPSSELFFAACLRLFALDSDARPRYGRASAILAQRDRPVNDEIRFYSEHADDAACPVTADEIRDVEGIGDAEGTSGARRAAPRAAQPAIYLGAAAEPAPALPVARAASLPSELPAVEARIRCPSCLERVPARRDVCPECGEPLNAPASPSRIGFPSIPDDPPGASWLAMHWRPLITLGTIASLLATGIALRYLAPGRDAIPPSAVRPTAAAAPAACSTACWNGEACEAGRCVWQKPNNVHHIAVPAEPTVSGPFALPKDVSDALPLNGERFAVALLGGIQLNSARTGGVIGLVSDAPQARRLYRVGQVLYATAPQRIYVVDPASSRLLKTIEVGAQVGDVVLGASGRRALASLPSAHAIAVLATEYHAEIDRIQFGDDPVGPMGADDTGTRALTTTGQISLPGVREPQGGAVYAFDPSRLASAQDRVRASMVGNPVSVLMAPDGEASYVVLRAEDALVPLEWLPSGAVRQEARIPTCRAPEQIELVRRERLGVIRCNAGRAIQIFDLQKRELVHHITFNAHVADLAISPDGEQAIVALSAEGTGFIGLVDLKTFGVRLLPISAEPSRVRLSPDGAMALLLSDRAKLAWVIR
jgi:DNA-binding beta-propeller fold protein YncE